MLRKQVGNVIVGASLENEAIKHTVQQVPQRPRKDQPRADDKPAVIFLPDDRPDIINPEDDCHKPEKGQRHLSPIAAKFPAPGHPLILHKIDLPLAAQELDAMAQWHMCLNPEFQRLVCDDDTQHQYNDCSRLHCLFD